jgi:flagellar L-ring protein precursor FlgH
MTRLLPLAAALLLAGCVSPRDFAREPHMTPVGNGLTSYREPLPTEAFPGPRRAGYHSLWDDSRADLFRDPRAAKVGDILTVNIRMNDKATLDNSSSRARESSTGINGSYGFGLKGKDLDMAGDGAGRIGVNSGSSARGEGSIDRS